MRFAKLYISVTKKDIEAIFHARKSLLYYNDESWVKTGESNFDFSIGAYDGAEVCDLIGNFMLSLLSKHIIKNHIGVFRENSLPILKNTCGPEVENLKKKFQKLFKENDNLNDGSYRPYRKSNEETKYIHLNSDHPLSIIKQISQSIEKRLNFVII